MALCTVDSFVNYKFKKQHCS